MFRTVCFTAACTILLTTYVVQAARVRGDSMAPTLVNRDRLFVWKAGFRFFASPRRGDVVVIRYPAAPGKQFVKRVVGVPGDVVCIDGGRLAVNGRSELEVLDPLFHDHGDYGPVTIAPGHFFVLGDHRGDSFDSRDWGQVPERYVLGRVVFRWWPLAEAAAFPRRPLRLSPVTDPRPGCAVPAPASGSPLRPSGVLRSPGSFHNAPPLPGAPSPG